MAARKVSCSDSESETRDVGSTRASASEPPGDFHTSVFLRSSTVSSRRGFMRRGLTGGRSAASRSERSELRESAEWHVRRHVHFSVVRLKAMFSRSS